MSKCRSVGSAGGGELLRAPHAAAACAFGEFKNLKVLT